MSFFRTQQDRVRSRFNRQVDAPLDSDRVARAKRTFGDLTEAPTAAARGVARQAYASLAESERLLRQYEQARTPAEIMKQARTRKVVAGAWIQASAEVSELTMEWLSLVARPVADALREEMIPFARAVVDHWPRRTGLSADGLILSVQRRGEHEVVAALSSAAHYTFFVRFGRGSKGSNQPPGVHAWTHLVRGPHAEIAPRVAERIERSWGKP